jgi:hypothetical protein
MITLKTDLEEQHGEPVYFPFYRYGGDQIRTQQAYLVKFPIELFDVIPGISDAKLDAGAYEDEPTEVAEDYQPKGAKAPSGRTTRAQDPKLRAAIERRSLDVALQYYDSIGGTNPRELGKPYDIAISVGAVERHCEVKGSSMIVDTVELTINEVNHGNDCGNVDLIVVDGIDYERDKETGDIHAHGGRLRVWTDWSPADGALRPQKFAYTLPAHPED